MSVYAFVFARGGSKGLPGKNIKPLGGIPLIGHSIRVARQLDAVVGVFVSTDSEQIASVAQQHGAQVIARPAALATDEASEWMAWQHAIEYLHARGERFDTFLSLPATSPLRDPADVQRCLLALDAHTDVVVTVTPAARSPYFNMVKRAADGTTEVLLKDSGYHRRQDAPPLYDMTTVAYVSRPEFILRSDGLFAGKVRSVVVPKQRAVDIDDDFDFVVAEALYAAKPS